MGLAVVDGGLQHLALRGKPVAEIDQLGVARREFILQMRGAAIQRDALDAAMRGQQHRAARRLIDAARLHADIAPLDQIEPPHAVAPADGVQRRQHRRRAERLAVQRHRVALVESDLDELGRVRRILGRDGALIDDVGGLLRRILQHLALAGGVQQVGVHAERRLAALVGGHRHLMRLRPFDQPRARGQIPLPPRRDHLDVGLQRIGGKLEAHLIVALAGGAMGHGVGAGLARDLDQMLRDQRPRDGGAEQIQPLIDRVGAKHRKHEVAHELLAHVAHEDVFGLHPQQFGLGARGRQLLALAEVGGEGHHLAAIGDLKPLQDDRGVETAGIGEDDLLRREGGLGHGRRAP